MKIFLSVYLKISCYLLRSNKQSNHGTPPTLLRLSILADHRRGKYFHTSIYTLIYTRISRRVKLGCVSKVINFKVLIFVEFYEGLSKDVGKWFSKLQKSLGKGKTDEA